VLTAFGLMRRHVGALATAPFTALLAWSLLIWEYAPSADAAWYSVAAGGCLMLSVAVIRWHLRAQDLDDGTPTVVALDLTAMAILVSVPVLRSANDVGSLLLSVALGIGLLGYGALSRVRRRLIAGGATVLLSVALALLLPLAGLVRAWQGWTLWLVLGAVGLAALAAAGLAERRRGHEHSAVADQWHHVTAGWE
jgi:hypothetical protein